jgi:hypothetical protein
MPYICEAGVICRTNVLRSFDRGHAAEGKQMTIWARKSSGRVDKRKNLAERSDDTDLLLEKLQSLEVLLKKLLARSDTSRRENRMRTGALCVRKLLSRAKKLANPSSSQASGSQASGSQTSSGSIHHGSQATTSIQGECYITASRSIADTFFRGSIAETSFYVLPGSQTSESWRTIDAVGRACWSWKQGYTR